MQARIFVILCLGVILALATSAKAACPTNSSALFRQLTGPWCARLGSAISYESTSFTGNATALVIKDKTYIPFSLVNPPTCVVGTGTTYWVCSSLCRITTSATWTSCASTYDNTNCDTLTAFSVGYSSDDRVLASNPGSCPASGNPPSYSPSTLLTWLSSGIACAMVVLLM
jgi:hypothetical protein